MNKHYHFIGVGGVGMSGLASILLKKGAHVTGSDLAQSPVLEDLRAKGALIYVGHNALQLASPDAVVYSSGIPKDNPEYVSALQRKIPLLHRSELLAQIMEGYAPLLVTGTHGKTTTSSMLAYALIQAGLDPAYAIGGFFDGMGSNGQYGKGIYFVAEADESDGSFINYPSFGAIITNLEQDHMDYWKTEEALIKGYERFASQVGSKDHLFWCYDDPVLRSLQLGGSSFGFEPQADLCIDNFQQMGWKTQFDLTYKGVPYREIELSLVGAHNVLNAASVFGMGLKLDIPIAVLRNALQSFRGVGRRLEKKGRINEVEVYDDYAHHPTEIFATLRALRCVLHDRRIVVAFQPHRYSRTADCMDDFADAFVYADEVVVTDIYSAGEKPLPGITPEKILTRMKKGGHPSTSFVEKEKLVAYFSNHLKPGDVLITMGAGDITHLGPALLAKWQGMKRG